MKVLLAAIAAAMLIPASASAYVHEANCQSALRGASLGTGIDLDHDDDIHEFGVRYGLRSFIGYGGSIRPDAMHIEIHLAFGNNVGTTSWAWGMCYQSGKDDWIADYVLWTRSW